MVDIMMLQQKSGMSMKSNSYHNLILEIYFKLDKECGAVHRYKEHLVTRMEPEEVAVDKR